MRKTYLALAVMLLAPTLLIGLTASAPYDPWNDLDENGKIDIFDVVRIAGTYGTAGDPGKNVTVTNWPAKQVLNASLAYNLVVPAQSSIQLSADVAGYDRLTLVVAKSYGGPLMVSVHYKYGEVYSPSIWETPDLSGGSHIILNDSVVIGPTLWINLENTDFDALVSVAIYATETSR